MSNYTRNITLLDSRLLNTFIAAAHTESFTAAATRANMTQSGVSQQIAKLEEQIGTSLFKRVGKKVVLTSVGHALKRHVIEQISVTQQFVEDILSNESHISGLVSYGMPPSCLLSPHFSMLLERRKAHPNIELNITLASSLDVEQMLLADRLDFGFVTDCGHHPLLDYQLFCQEQFILVSSNLQDFVGLSPETLHERRFILYPGANYYYDRWLQHIFPQTRSINTHSLLFAGEINSIHGAIEMAMGGLGMMVIPLHCISSPLENKKLFCQPDQEALLNDIFITTIKGHPYPLRVRSVINWFMDIYRSEH